MLSESGCTGRTHDRSLQSLGSGREGGALDGGPRAERFLEMHSAITRSGKKSLAATVAGQPSGLFSCAPLVHEN
jgi:hypothetical protein